MATSNRTIIFVAASALMVGGCAGPGGGGAGAPIEEHATHAPTGEAGASRVPAPQPAVAPAPRVPGAGVPPAPAATVPPAPTRIARAEEAYRPPPPANPAVQSLIGAAREASARGEWERAQAALERALKLSPDDAALWTQLAYTHYRRGALEQAQELAERGLVLSSASGREDPAIWRLIAEIETARGRPEAARQARERAAGSVP